MMSFWVSLSVLIVGLVHCSTSVQLPTTVQQVSDASTILVSLSSYNESNKQDQAFTVLTNINANANFIVRVDDIPAAVTFVVIQVHAHLYNVSISYDKVSSRTPGKFVIGTNVGLLVETNDVSFAQVYVTNKNNLEIDALVAVVAYTNNAPYPGGCNMEFDIERSPFQKLVYDRATVTVDAQPAAVQPKIGVFEPLCDRYPLQHEAYRVYMPEQDFTNQTYFLAVASMLTVRDIITSANLVPASLFGSPMRRVYSVYPGTGSVFGMIAHFANYSSAYVPIVTYGCDVTTSCSSLESTFLRVVCALTFFLGIFMTMRGYEYFKTSMLLMGMLAGGFVGYAMSASNSSTDDATGAVAIAILTGTITSLVWFLLWTTFSSPIPSLALSGLTLGSFFFYVFYYTIPGELLYLEFELYFWLLFSSFVLLVILIFSVIPLVGNILCFTALGAYATVFSMDYYSGSNLKYIAINGVRRITAANFNVALIQPPYQNRDILLTFFWIFLVILGLYKQCASSSSRAPYPPSASALVASSEGAPILGGPTYRNRYKTFYNHQPNPYDRL